VGGSWGTAGQRKDVDGLAGAGRRRLGVRRGGGRGGVHADALERTAPAAAIADP
jgi:hypothetical protein